jgi:hypothetical protein
MENAAQIEQFKAGMIGLARLVLCIISAWQCRHANQYT